MSAAAKLVPPTQPTPSEAFFVALDAVRNSAEPPATMQAIERGAGLGNGALSAARKRGGVPGLDSVLAISRVLGCPVRDLLGDATPPELDARPPTTEPAVDLVMPNGAVPSLTYDAIGPSPMNPRRGFDQGILAELANSIVSVNLLQPILVRPPGGADPLHRIVAGERRWRAIGIAIEDGRLPRDWPIPVVIRRGLTDAEHRAIAIIENLQRHDVPPLDEAEGFKALIEEAGWSTADIAAKIGKTVRHVQLRLALVDKLAEPVKQALRDGELTLAQARAFTAASPDRQLELLERVGENHTADHVARLVSQENFPASRAIFDLARFTGPTTTDDESGELIFQDSVLFDYLQREAIKEKTKQLAIAGTGVVMLVETDWWSTADYAVQQAMIYRAQGQKPKGAQTAVVIQLKRDLSVIIHDNLWKLDKKPPATKASTPAKDLAPDQADPVEAVTTGRKIYAKQAKTRALQDTLFFAAEMGNPRVLNELTCLALITAAGAMAGLRSDDRGEENRVVGAQIAVILDRFADAAGRKLFAEGKPCLSALDHYNTTGAQDTVRKALGTMTDAAVQTLTTALLAARCHDLVEAYNPHMGSQPATIELAERLNINMPEWWRIDDAYLATLRKDQLETLAFTIGLYHAGKLDAVTPADFGTMKATERRAAILRFAETNDVRHIPPELEFHGALMIEAGIRQEAKAAS
ncbi:MAG TPA: ParB/RepB/Spo0J family partition protein [Stellaceae bacterium]|nr:ParB/RepB/Spo0J family partition protein [Stellaceae bacterium]